VSKGKQGGNTGGIERSPEKTRRRAAARRAEERRWAAKAGPVTVTRVQSVSDAHRPSGG